MKIIKDDKLEIQTRPLSEAETQRLWQGVYQRIKSPATKPLNIWPRLGRRIYIPAAIFILLFTLSFGTAVLSVNAKPGDVLFPVKLAYEKVQLQLTFDPEKKSDLALHFSQERLKEVNEVLSQNSNKIIPPEARAQDEDKTTSTPPVKVEIKEESKKESIKKLEKNHQTLINALDYLENTKEELKKTSNEQKLEEINSLVDQLSDRTQNYLDDLEEIKEKIPNYHDIKNRINRSEKELKEKFKLEPKQINGRFDQSDSDSNNNNNNNENNEENNNEEQSDN